MSYPPYGGGPGYPPAGPGYPPPSSGGYPPPQPGYPPTGGYPPMGGPGYPAGGPPAPGYPPAQGYPPASGYPMASGYPPPPPGQGYPPTSGYPTGSWAPPPGGGYPAPGMPPAGQYPPQSGQQYQQPPQQYQQPPQQYQQPPQQYQQPPQQYQQPPQQQYGHPQGQGNLQSSAPPPANTTQAPPRPKQPSPAAKSGAPVAQMMASMSLGGQKYGHPVIVPVSPFDAEAICEQLRKAMRGMGTDEQTLINLLVKCSNAQRVEVRKRYKTMFGKDLMNDLKSELSGNLEDCLLALMEPSVLYDAKCLRRAMRGAGTDEESLIDILCTRTNKEIAEIKQAYKDYYKRDLEKDCVSETSGHFKRLLVSMCQGNRDESGTVDMEKARKEANDLFQAGEKKWGTDESRFNVVLASRNFNQLRATFDEYIKIAQRDILNSIDREMSGDLKTGFKCIVQCARNPSVYFAERLWKSMKGAGTDDATLIRVVVSRSEVDLVEIKASFLQTYHKTLYKMIQGDCSGDYKKLLQAVVGMN